MCRVLTLPAPVSAAGSARADNFTVCRLKFLQTAEWRRPPDWPSVAGRRLPATLYGCLNGWGAWGGEGDLANNFLPAPPAAQPTQEKQEICFKWDGGKTLIINGAVESQELLAG